MENNNNIDKTFNEASKTLEEPATFPGFDKVWSTIEERLDKKQEKKKIIPMWLPYGIAASLLIGSGIFYFTNNKNNNEITKPVIAQNVVSLEKSSVAVPEHIQKIDSTVKANIQSEMLPPPPVKMAYKPEIPRMYNVPFIAPPSYVEVSPPHTDAIAPALEDKKDSLRSQNIEEVIAMGIKKEKASMVNSLAAASSTRKKLSELNAVADTAEAAYPVSVFDLKQETHEPEILAYNKGYLKAKQPIASNSSGFANKLGSKEGINTIRGAFSGVNINSISGTPGSGKVDISISCQGSSNLNNGPLYVIDGVATDVEVFKKIDPKKIESIRVFKGEKAISLFGSKATNGAILVETKDISKKEKRKLEKLLKDELPKK